MAGTPQLQQSNVDAIRRSNKNSLHPSSSNVPSLQVDCLCKCDQITSMFSNFDTQKTRLVESIGFGGLLKLPMFQTVNPDLCLWLYQIADFERKCLNVAPGVQLKFDDPDVNLVLGIPCGTEEVVYNPNPSKQTVGAFIAKISKNKMPSPQTLSCLEEILLRDYPSEMTTEQKEAFSIAFVLYVCSFLLDPQARHRFPNHLLRNLVRNHNPADMNWCGFVLANLERASKYVKHQINERCSQLQLLGCSLFLQVFYIDNLNFGPASPYHGYLPRASAYLPDLMNDIIVSDCIGLSNNNIMEFGKRKVRPSCDVIYTRGWEHHQHMLDDSQDLSREDYLTCMEIMSQGIRLLDKFATPTSHLTNTGQNQWTQDIVATRNSYEAFQTTYNRKYNSTIRKLSNKAGQCIMRRNLTLFERYIPRLFPCTTMNPVSIGSSNRPIYTAPTTLVNPGCFTFERIQDRNFPLIHSKKLSKGKHQDRNSCPMQPQQSSSHMIISTQHPHRASGSYELHAPGFEPKIIRSHSNFPMSPFDQNLTHPRVDKYIKLISYQWLTTTPFTNDELDSPWVLFSEPSLLSINGHVMRHCLKQDGHFTVAFVDATMRLWNYLDGKQYHNIRKRWRHFLPASFAESVKNGNDFLNSDLVRSCFLGHHITYDLQDVQKIILPLFGPEDSWTCLIWDFKFKTITVLDPILMQCPPSKVMEKHETTVMELHHAICACIQYYFRGWDTDTSGWVPIYRTDIASKRKLQNTGLYIVHFARAFDGNKIAFSLKDTNSATLFDARGEILYEFMVCTENKSSVKRLFAQIF